MEFTSFDERELVIDVLKQIKTAISQLQEWNAEVTSEEELIKSPMEDYYLNAQRFLGEMS